MKLLPRRVALSLIACLALAWSPSTARAGFVTNLEPNNTFATAQVIPATAFTLEFQANIGRGAGAGFVNTSTTIPHATVLRPGTGQPTANLDYFRFATTTPGQLIVDVDTAPQATNFDTHIHLFNSLGMLLGSSDDNGGDPGDGGGAIGGTLNSRLQTLILPPGTYVVAVALAPSVPSPGGAVTGPIPALGSYTLHISASGAGPTASVPAPPAAVLMALGATGLLGFASWLRRRTG